MLQLPLYYVFIHAYRYICIHTQYVGRRQTTIGILIISHSSSKTFIGIFCIVVRYVSNNFIVNLYRYIISMNFFLYIKRVKFDKNCDVSTFIFLSFVVYS